MEAAKAAVQKITGHRGQHTTVEETVNPAVTRETIKPHRHEEATEAVDREVHQHHYHTTVQPLQHQEKLPEKHTHNILPTEEREFHHDNPKDTEMKLSSELGHFKDHRTTEQVRQTQSVAPSVTGEHVHHHVHETVVPVVHKETIQPEVVHTTIPVHETHYAAAQHHGLSALPMKTLDEFKNAGGVLTGGKHSAHEEYEGAPRKYNEKLSTTLDKLGLEAKEAVGGHHNSSMSNSHTGNGVGNDAIPRNRAEAAGTTGNDVGGGLADKSNLRKDSGVGGLGNGNDLHRKEVGSNTHTKPSLKERLDPRVDADGDGKRGFAD